MFRRKVICSKEHLSVWVEIYLWKESLPNLSLSIGYLLQCSTGGKEGTTDGVVFMMFYKTG